MTDESSDTERVLTPDELRLEDSNHVVSLEDDRYLVSPTMIDDSTANRIKDAASDPSTDESGGDEGESVGPLTIDDARASLLDSLADADATYAIEMIGTIEGQNATQRTVTNDVSTAFERLLLWYAHAVGDDTPVEDVVAILLAHSSIPPTAIAPMVGDLVGELGLDHDDSIAQLLAAIENYA